MLVDFKEVHSRYLQPVISGRSVTYNAANPDNPKLGFFPASHQIFSNNALQVALYIYNPGDMNQGQCSSVSHCLYLNFTNKSQGQYLLNNDSDRITFQLDVGVAKSLYQFTTGLTSKFEYRAVRQGKAPKVLKGYVENNGKEEVVVLEAATVNDVGNNIIRVQLSASSGMALSAYALGYARLLYPSFSDMALLSMFSIVRQAAPTASTPKSPSEEAPLAHFPGAAEPQIRACADLAPQPSNSHRDKRLARVIWAIGNQKWHNMRIDALQAIQAEPDTRLQELIDQANRGDFRQWDSYL
jgi:hypothetical protein